MIPFCIILFAEGTPLKDEKIIFHNINSKAIPIKSEQLLKSVLIETNPNVTFSDEELTANFGVEFLVVRNLIKERPLLVRKLHSIRWIQPNLMTVLVDLVNYVGVEDPIQSNEQKEAFYTCIAKALDHAEIVGTNELAIPSGLLFLLASLYYKVELEYLDPEHKAEQYKNNLLQWAKRYSITEVQNDFVENAAVNANCIRTIFDKYLTSADQTIFLSRCFSNEYDENEHAVRRVIEHINAEKNSALKLIRVDQHTEGATGQISDHIFRDIESAGLVIADLSSGRSNIPHEIGYAMGLKKDLIIIHNGTSEQAEAHTPSNIKMFEQIRFNGNYHQMETELKTKLIDYYKL